MNRPRRGDTVISALGKPYVVTGEGVHAVVGKRADRAVRGTTKFELADLEEVEEGVFVEVESRG